MKKVLILAYDFPPNRSIGGARPESWTAHFSKYGIKPHLVSRIWEEPLNKDIDVVRSTEEKEVVSEITEEFENYFVPFKPVLRDKLLYKHGLDKFSLLRKLLTLLHKLVDFWFLPPVYRRIYKKADELIKFKNIDCIIVTGEPFLLFKIGDKLSRKNKIPWVADYRDCWTSERVATNSTGLDKLLYKLYFPRIEKMIVKSASLITTPAPSYKKDLELIFPSKNIEVVYNGFFEEKVSSEILNMNQSTAVLTIAYVGVLYPHQKLELFLKGVHTGVKKGGQKLKVIFYGLEFYPDQKNRVLMANKGLDLDLEFTPKIPYDEMIKALKKSNICLVLSSSGADWLNTKIFDYLLANRETLLVEDDKGILNKIINETESGTCLTTEEEISNYVFGKLNEFKRFGKVKEPLQNLGFSRLKQSERMCELLKELN